jgi:Fic family protein
MFNPKKPYNDLPLLPPKKVDFESKAILKQLMKAKVELARLDSFIRNIRSKELFLESFAIREAVESSQIENINTTVEELYKSEYEVKMAPEQKETLHYKRALLHGYELIKKRGILTINDYCSIGEILSPK